MKILSHQIAAHWLMLVTAIAWLSPAVSGHIARRATPGADAIKLLGDPQMQDIQVDYWWEDKHWPAESHTPPAA